MPTLRLLVVLLAAAPVAGLGDPWVLVAAAWVGVAVLASLVDAWLAADTRRVRVRREVQDKVSLGVWNPVRLAIDNTGLGGRRLSLTLRDVPPTDWRVDVGLPVFPLRLDLSEHVTYHVLPRQRGDAAFGDLYLRVTGPLGLVQRQWRALGSGRQVRVYPNLRDLRKYDLLVRRGLQV